MSASSANKKLSAKSILAKGLAANGANALKLVDSAPFSVEELDFSDDEVFYKGSHSLHSIVPFASRSKAEYARFFIERYSGVGDKILDPFVGSGTTVLEACLRARNVVAVDTSEIALNITRAKLQPADIAQVTLALQLLNVRRPVNPKFYETYFEPFYDIRTFCELLNLKTFVNDNQDRVRNFIHSLALSLLHGHSSGHFSGYSFPQIAPSPKDQLALNIKRHQYPDYRPIVPRLIRRAAVVLRDGVPSILERTACRSEIVKSDARDLSFIKTAGIDFIYTAPPIPQDLIKAEASERGLWLRNWFSDVENEQKLDFSFAEEGRWKNFMNETLLELARVTRSGGRLVFEIKQQETENDYAEAIVDLVNSDFRNFWNAESLYVVRDQHETLKHALKARTKSRRQGVVRFVVLRRR